MDIEEVTDEMKQRPKRQFCSREREGLKHRGVETTVGRRLCQCIRCNEKESIVKFRASAANSIRCRPAVIAKSTLRASGKDASWEVTI